ncbi:hypothetical protein ISR94_03545 [Candidatus Microgenomates bacterium]|nr:hypothetical protein [Candidatus Microgenomates bacterium]
MIEKLREIFRKPTPEELKKRYIELSHLQTKENQRDQLIVLQKMLEREDN